MQTALGTVRKALRQGAGLVVLLLLFFMGHARSSMLVTVQLPLAALATVMLAYGAILWSRTRRA